MSWMAQLTAVIFAHQGGWDELILVGAPVTIFGALLLVAKRRAREIDRDR